MKKVTNIGKLNPNEIKSRDLVHLQELTHGTGCGPHKSKRDTLKRQERQQRQKGVYNDH
jgi:hypothetical protein